METQASLIKIPQRWSDTPICEIEARTLGEAVVKAVAKGVNFTRANLRGADLSGANLRGADLSGADLTIANLTRADLFRANLTGANLSGANLTRADLTPANLTGANLGGANLSGADLGGANFTYANLSRANFTEQQLRSCLLTPIRDDIWAVLSASPTEARGLRDTLAAGKVDGSCYEGTCCCLCGTIANVAGLNVFRMPTLRPNAARAAERWFLAIRPEDTAENSPIVKITLEWIDEWLSAMRKAFGTTAIDQ